MPLCRLCSEDRNLVKAHIVPEAFFRVLRDPNEPLLLITNTPGHYPKRSQVGVYDQGILCGECESKFGEVDDYGIQVFLNRFDEFFQPINHQGESVGFQAQNVDKKLLLRFLVATIWRASVSTHRFYDRVHLGPYEAAAAEVVTAPDRPISNVFDALLSCWTSSEECDYFTQGLMDPFREQWDGVNAYRFYFGRVVAYIKVSNRQFLAPLSERTITSQNPLTVVARNFDKSTDFSAMVRTAKESRRPRGPRT